MQQAPSSRSRRVTAADVARAAGVSRATVSYVLNDTPTQSISDRTREKVLATAEHLGYAPSPAARMLRTGTSDLVLITTQPLPSSLAFATFIEALVAKLRSFGFSPLVHFDETGDVDALLQTCGQLQLAGFIDLSSMLSSPVASRRVVAAGTRGIVTFSPAPSPDPTDAPRGARVIAADLAVPGQMAVEHLAGHGYRSVVGLAPSSPAFGLMATPRMEGARRAADAAGLAYEAAAVELTPEAVGEFADELAARRGSAGAPEAVFAYNDDYALLLIRCLLDRGIDVPDDVAVIGCDNNPAGELIEPKLTTVDLGHAAVGTFVAELLHGEIAGTPLPADATPPEPVVVSRASA